MRFFLWILIAFSLSLAAGLYWKSRGENQGQAAETINASKETVMTNTLIGHWTLDGNNIVWDDSTTEIKDSTANANHGNALGALARSSVVPGMAGQGVSFDGSTDYMNFGSASSLDDIELQGGGGMTVSVWVKRGQDIINENLIGKGYLYGGWYLTFSANQLRFRRYYDTTSINCFSNTGYSDGPWMHIVFTWTGSADMPGGVEFYKNGAVVSKVSCSQDGVGNKPSDGTRSLVAGIYESDLSSEPFLGDMDDIRIYNSVLTATQVADLYRATGAKKISNANHREALTNGLVGYWTFDGRDTKWSDSSTEIKDISGNNNHGDAVNLTTASVVPGKLGQGMGFDGSGDYVNAGSDVSISDLASFSLSLWAKPSSLTNNETVASAYAWRFFFDTSGTNKVSFYHATDGTWLRAYSTNNVFASNSWVHMVVTTTGYTGTDTHIFINGSEVGYDTRNSGTGTFLGDSSLFIGAHSYTATFKFSGNIDDVRMYNRVLSSKEVTNLYNLGK